jgi:hypothetical protein
MTTFEFKLFFQVIIVVDPTVEMDPSTEKTRDECGDSSLLGHCIQDGDEDQLH